MAKKVTIKTSMSVGLDRLPGRVSMGSKAYWNKTSTISSRESLAGVIDKFESFLNGIKTASPNALEIALAPTFEKAATYCPVDTGELVNSADIKAGFNVGGNAYCRISFGGGGVVKYAAIVHERTDLHHSYPTRSKYLQAAVEEDLSTMKRRYTMALKSLLGL